MADEIIKDEFTTPEVQEAPAEKVELYVPIKPGDTVESLADEYHTTPEAIIERNKLNPSFILVGQWIFV